MSSHKASRGKHEGLVSVVAGILKTQNIPHKVDLEYDKGQMDVYSNRLYYEIKYNHTDKGTEKAISQIRRAMMYNQCDYGYMVTSTGVYDVLQDLIIKI